MIKFKTTFDDSGFRRLERKLKALEKPQQVPFSELFNASFMARHTRFATIDAMFEASGYRVDSQEDFEAIPDADWDRFIAANTSFPSWQDMQNLAAQEWMKAQLNL